MAGEALRLQARDHSSDQMTLLSFLPWYRECALNKCLREEVVRRRLWDDTRLSLMP